MNSNNNNIQWILPGVKAWLDISKANPDISYTEVEVLSIESSKKIIVKTLKEDKTIETDSQNLLERNEETKELDSFCDLVQMSVLNEAEILNNLSQKFAKDQIFTNIGPTLLIMNPYKEIPELFNEKTTAKFREKREEPHIFSIASQAFTQLLENSRNQAIVISGESGAGKTETAKYSMKFLTSSTFSGKFLGDDAPIEEKILRCNPILEAFGNAKTIRNDNSSRFGKFVRLLINKNSKSINGATITCYLLEKSRLSAPSKGERNFHIFYHMLAGLDGKDLENYRLYPPIKGDKTIDFEFFQYLKKSQCYTVAKIDDKALFQEVVSSFHKTGFAGSEIKGIFRLLSAILHLGNLEFSDEKLTDTSPCMIKSGDIEIISQLLCTQQSSLTKALVFKTREIQGQTIESPHPVSECLALRDSLSKFLYEKLFNWLVKRLNLVIFPAEEASSLRKVRKSIKLIRDSLSQLDSLVSSIGLLDIFGFENFANNSFEQLCINFTNEKLQQLYVSYVFKSEEKELIEQGLQNFLKQLTFQDNQAVIDLLDKYPSGIYDLLDESSSLGSGSDELLLNKLAKTHAKNPCFSLVKNRPASFLIVHTAKPVEYEIKGFRAKNKDEIPNGIHSLLQGSKDEILIQMFQNMSLPGEKSEINEKKKLGSVGVSKADKFLGAKFRNQMKDLMGELFSCEVHFIRCIKPNENKKENLFVADFVLLQIRYLGLLDTIKIRKQGFPLRKDFKSFCQKYREICGLPLKNPNFQEVVKKFFEKNPEFLKEIGKKILIGNTKVYLKQEIADLLDGKLHEVLKRKISVGKRVLKQYRVYRFRKKTKLALKKLAKFLKSFAKIQAIFKGRKQRARFLKKKLATMKITNRLRILFLCKFFLLFNKKMKIFLKNSSFHKGFCILFRIKPWKSLRKSSFSALKSVSPKKKPQKVVVVEEKKTVQLPLIPQNSELSTEKSSVKISINNKVINENSPNLTKPAEKPKPKAEFSLKSVISSVNSSEKAQEIQEKKASSPLKSPFIEKKLVQPSLKEIEVPLHINLSETPEKQSKKKDSFLIDPRNFGKNFMDFSEDLKQNSYSPLHHYTIYGANQEPESLSFSFIPVSDDCFNDFQHLDQNFLMFVKETDWRNFIEKLLMDNRKNKKQQVNLFEKNMSHSKNVIKKSLLNLNSKYNDLALLTFKYILQYSEEKKTKFALSIQVKKLFKILISTKELELIDEFYLQIMKQLINCPTIQIQKKLLTLLGTISSVIAITPRMYLPFLSFLYSNIITTYREDQESLHSARYCFLRIKNLFDLGSRREIPLDNELFLIENRKKIVVPVSFLSGNHIFIFVESYTTVKEAIHLALAKVSLLSKFKYFGLFLVKKSEDISKTEEKFLDFDVRILDVLTIWELEEKSKFNEMKLFIRQRVFYTFYSDDLDSFETLYNHFVYEVLKGRLKCDEQTALKLGALSLAVDHGDFSKEKSRFLNIDIQRYIPEKFLQLNSPQIWIDKILIFYLKFKIYNSIDAKLQYLDEIKNNDFFWAEQFTIEYLRKNHEESESKLTKNWEKMLLAIKPNAIKLYKFENQDNFVCNYTYKEIAFCGNQEKFVLLVETADNLSHLIKNPRSDEIDYLIKYYKDLNS